MLRLGIMVGTRPEAIKMAPVIAACRAHPDIDTTLILSGQHRDMVAPILKFFEISADVDMGAMEGEAGLTPLFTRIAAGVDAILAERTLDEMLVHGDTTTAAATALACFHRGVPVGHVEAGLRTDDLTQPFPEEYNRRLIDLSARHHFAPTPRAARMLASEGVATAEVTGNTVVDALYDAVARIDADAGLSAALEARFGAARPIVLVTAHRRENFGKGLEALCLAIRQIAGTGLAEIVFPVHLNPNVQGPIRQRLGGLSGVRLVPPLDYPAFVWLMRRASLILTDSGGVQEEAPSFGTPVLVMRDKTERPEGVAAGFIELVGTDADRLAGRAIALLRDPKRPEAGPSVANPYGDGRATERIVASLLAAKRARAA